MNTFELPVKLNGALLASDYKDLKSLDKNTLLNKNLLGAIGCIPVIGAWVTAAIDSGLSFQDAKLFRKVFAFIYEIKETTQEERKKFIEEIEETAQDVSGNVICEMIDRLDNINKASILANLMKYKIKGEISIVDFFRLASVSERIPYPDLFKLKDYQKDNYIDGGVTEILYSSGALNQTSLDEKQNQYSLSHSGRKLLKYGLMGDVSLDAKTGTYIEQWQDFGDGTYGVDKRIDQALDDEAMFQFDLGRGK